MILLLLFGLANLLHAEVIRTRKRGRIGRRVDLEVQSRQEFPGEIVATLSGPSLGGGKLGVTATRFYLHAATSTDTGTLPGATANDGTPDVTAAGASTNRAMTTTIGTAQTSIAVTTKAQTAQQSNWFGRWLSPPLQGQSYSAQLTLNCGASVSNASSPLEFAPSLYLWRPSTGQKIGATLVTGRAALGYGTTTSLTEVNYPGAASGIFYFDAQDGDILVLEVWGVVTQTMATAYTNTFFYDGTTVGSATSNAANILLTSPITLQPSGTIARRDFSARFKLLGAPVFRDFALRFGFSRRDWTWRQGGSGTGTSGGAATNTTLFTTSIPVQAGDTVIVVVGAASAPTVTDSNAQTYNSTAGFFYWQYSVTGLVTVRANWPGASVAYAYAYNVYSGLQNAVAGNSFVTSSTATAQDATWDQVTTTGADMLALGAIYGNTAGQNVAVTPGSGWTVRQDTGPSATVEQLQVTERNLTFWGSNSPHPNWTTPANYNASYGAIGFLTSMVWRPFALRFGLAAGAAAFFRDFVTRFRVVARNYRDFAARVRLVVQGYRDFPLRYVLTARNWRDFALRFRLTAQAWRDFQLRYRLVVRGYRDFALRYVLTAQNWRDFATRFRLVVRGYRDFQLRFRLGVAGVFRDFALRFILNARNWRDFQLRFRLGVLNYRDFALRFRMVAQGYRDFTLRLLLAAQAWRDLQMRFRLGVLNYRDFQLRFRMAVRGYRDFVLRFRLVVQNWRDFTTRFSLVVRGYRDFALRYRLTVQAWRDFQLRFRVAVQNWRDFAVRFRTAARNWRDFQARFLLAVQGFRDFPLRFRLRAQNWRDFPLRFYLQVPGQYRDFVMRFRLRGQAWRDFVLRFRLGVLNWRDFALRFSVTVRGYRDFGLRFRMIVQSFRDFQTRFALAVRAYRDFSLRFRIGVQSFRDFALRFRTSVASIRDFSLRFIVRIPVAWRDFRLRFGLLAGSVRDFRLRFQVGIGSADTVTGRDNRTPVRARDGLIWE